MGLNRWLCQ